MRGQRRFHWGTEDVMWTDWQEVALPSRALAASFCLSCRTSLSRTRSLLSRWARPLSRETEGQTVKSKWEIVETQLEQMVEL